MVQVNGKMNMFSHMMLGTNDLQKAIDFYDGVMPTLGYGRHATGETFAGYGLKENIATGIDCLWIGTPLDGQPASSGNGANVALLASNRKMVDAFHRKAIKQGGTDEGEPGIRSGAHENFYATYVRDLDGNKLVVVCHSPE